MLTEKYEAREINETQEPGYTLKRPSPVLSADITSPPPERPGGRYSVGPSPVSSYNSVLDKTLPFMDPEKGYPADKPNPDAIIASHGPGGRPMLINSPSNTLGTESRTTILYREDEPDHEEIKNRALTILLYLSFPCVIISTSFCLITIPLSVLAVLALPVVQSPSTVLNSTLGALLQRQLRFIHASAGGEPSYNTPALITVLLLSPFVAFAAALAAWTAAVFWIFALIIGNPDGDDRYNDGRAAVLWVRKWWERWLLKPIR